MHTSRILRLLTVVVLEARQIVGLLLRNILILCRFHG